ncbi:hypothetical protein CYQ88_06240 [Hydrogenovibrio sp. SC-1]|uniref:hypothetical protein n=1 Tax=Hydrogenovibrio sp. SC-1 TaxID=2065820 RepID=UPI000C7CDDEF|nr:hypothetical protein [Hydrogenovibrio sp. SC-1]PLA74476.1 hypothetical protein CYQ88_06240 [Hydrogenovibrio sp. SC-1]
MKFSQRLFLLLFLLSFLHSSFAQAGVSMNLPVESPSPEMHKETMSHQHHSKHDCCDESTENMAVHICQFCGDDCQCLNDCHVSSASIVLIGTNIQHHPFQPERLIQLTDSPLFSVDGSLEKRPPRFA